MCSSDLINQLSSHFPVFVYRLAAQMRDSRTRDNKRKHCVKAWTELNISSQVKQSSLPLPHVHILYA